MTLDWGLQDAVQRQVRSVDRADRVKRSPNRVESEILENLHGEGRAREFSFVYDEPAHVAGGENRGPRPLEYFLAGFAFCQQVQYARQALLTGTEFDDLRMETEGNVVPGQTGFEDDTISGDLTKPDGEYIEARQRVRHSNLIRIREDFRDKILQSVGEL